MKIPNIKALLFMKDHSERVPRKNIRNFCGRPLFHWILESLSQSRFIDEIVINTDSEEIAKNAVDNFRVTIHMRPEYLLTITSNEAFQLMEYDLKITKGNYFLQTHSTTPLVKTSTLDNAIETFFNQNIHDSLISVTPIKKRFFTEEGKAINHNPDRLIKTQDLQKIYEENSCIYIFSREIMDKRKNRIGTNPLFFEMDPFESVDIDVMFDLVVAETIMKERLTKERRINID